MYWVSCLTFLRSVLQFVIKSIPLIDFVTYVFINTFIEQQNIYITFKWKETAKEINQT